MSVKVKKPPPSIVRLCGKFLVAPTAAHPRYGAPKKTGGKTAAGFLCFTPQTAF
jgi:hypothetical protein